MNDEIREQLSAYLDGALPEAERLELEGRLASSAELRGALEDLRAVSRAVKDLPQEPLPAGFMARLQARRVRGDAPRRDWVFLPPQARPVVAALSCGVIALMIWDKVAVPPEPEALHSPATAKVYAPANAPVAQLNMSRAASGVADRSNDAKSLDMAGPASERAKPGDDLAALDGAGGGGAETPKKAALSYGGAAAGGMASVRGGSARAPGSPISAGAGAAFGALSAPSAAPSAAAPAPEAPLADRTRLAMSEEERSAKNEEMIGQLERQKSSLGMRVLQKGESDDGGADFMGRRRAPAAPVVRAAVPSLFNAPKAKLGAATLATEPASAGPGRLAPDAALVLSDAGSLSSSWVLLGFPGEPPATDFESGRLVLIKPSATKILSVTPGPDAVTVVYRSLLMDEPSDPARDRVAPLPAAPKAVLIYDASPR